MFNVGWVMKLIKTCSAYEQAGIKYRLLSAGEEGGR
jgi:hypothetical protein